MSRRQVYSWLPIAKRSKTIYKVCGHCNRELSFKKYKEHKLLFFDESTQSWTKDLDSFNSGSSSEFSSLDDFDIGFGSVADSTTSQQTALPIDDADEDFTESFGDDCDDVTAQEQGIVNKLVIHTELACSILLIGITRCTCGLLLFMVGTRVFCYRGIETSV